MSQIRRSLKVVAAAGALLAALALGCSKTNDVAFDPDAGHPDDFLAAHPAAFRSSDETCTGCHGGDLLGGISKVSCYSASRDGRACHPGGPGGHPAAWRSLHTASDPAAAGICAVCHDNKTNNLDPNCFNNSLCHGAKSAHPAGWRTAHQGTSRGDAPGCAGCHPEKGTPSCFANSACHGGSQGNPHPSGWKGQHDKTPTSQASACAACHQSNAGTPGCYNNTLCHGNEEND